MGKVWSLDSLGSYFYGSFLGRTFTPASQRMKSELIHFFENMAVPKAQCSQALACEIGVALVQLDFIFGGVQFGHERSLHDTVVWAQSWIVHVRTAF